MKHLIFAAALPGLAVASPVSANASQLHEPVSLNSSHFQFNQETGRAQLVAFFTYNDNMIAGADDGGGPRSVVPQLPELVCDAQTHAVVYGPGEGHTVCAVIQESSGFSGRRSKVKRIGACSVTTEPANLTLDDGWSLHHLRSSMYFSRSARHFWWPPRW